MDGKPSSSKEKIITAVLIALALVAIIVTAILTNWRVMAVLGLAAAFVGGSFAFLKLKNTWARIAALVIAGLGLFWMCAFPAWSRLP